MTVIGLLSTGCTSDSTVCGSTPNTGSSTWALGVTDRGFAAGALCVFDETVEEAAPTSGDPLVRSHGDHVYVVNRAGGDAVSAYRIGSYDTPVWETSLPVGTNVHDALVSSGRLFLPSFGFGVLHVLDPETGADLDRLDLRASDPNASLDRIVESDGLLWVADQQRPLSSDIGRLIPIDPVTLAVGEPVVVPVNPRLTASDDGVWVSTGRFAFAETTLDSDVRDGLLARFVPGEGLGAPVLSESDEVADIHHVVDVDGSLVVALVTPEGSSRLRCGTDAGFIDGPVSGGWVVTMARDGVDVVVGIRSTFVFGEDDLADRGLRRLDPVRCTWVGELVPTVLEPYDLAVVPSEL